jgi:hypothetical protein
VKNNHAKSKVVVERLPMDGEEGDLESAEADADAETEEPTRTETGGRPEALGSRDNFWGG